VTAEQQHCRKLFTEGLAEIDHKVIRLFALVGEAVAGASEALLADDRAAAEVATEREQVVDRLERDLEELAESHLMLQAPVAGDMRYLLSVIRVVPELERSGDLAEHIARRASDGLATRLPPNLRAMLQDMATSCVAMWRTAGDAWAERDGDVAEHLELDDDRVDTLHDQLTAAIVEADLDPADVLQTTLLGRFYERLGDHAVHVTERIRYLAGT
jgi:phosphate transport system protein